MQLIPIVHRLSPIRITALSILAAVSATAFNLNFDAPSGGTFLAEFNQNGPGAPNFIQNTIGGGIGNTNAVDLTNQTADTTAIYMGEVYNLSTGTASVTLSGYFRNQTLGTLVGGPSGIFQIGFGSDAGDTNNTNNTGTSFNGTNAFGTNATKNFLTGRVKGDGIVEFQTGINGTTLTVGSTATNALVANNFYYLAVTFTRRTTANTFVGTVKLFNSDAAGVLGSKIAEVGPTVLTQSTLYTDSSVYAGFRAAGQSGIGPYGANLVDNFSATAVSGSEEPISIFAATPVAIIPGAASQLNWVIREDATTATIDNGVGNVLPNTTNGIGQVPVSPELNTTYSMTVSGAFGSETQTATVTVRPLATFTGTPNYIAPGAPVTLNWRVRKDASPVTISGIGNVNAQTSNTTGLGSIVVNPTADTVYTISSTAGGATETATVTVIMEPQGQLFALIDLGATGGRPETGANTGAVIGAGPDGTNAMNLAPVTLTSDTSASFTLALDNLNANGTAIGGLDWRDRGDGPNQPLVKLAEDLVKNGGGIIHVTLGTLPAGTYDIISYFIDPINSQSAAIQILVTDANGTAVNTGNPGNASYPGGADPGLQGVANLKSSDISAKSRRFSVRANGSDPVSIYFDGTAAVDTEVPLGGLRIMLGTAAIAAPTVVSVERTLTGGTATFAILFNSIPSKTYTVRTSPDLVDWTTVLTNTLPSGGTTTTFTESSIPLSIAKRFYKINQN